MTVTSQTLRTGPATVDLEVDDGHLRSVGAVSVLGTPLRNPSARFLPWFDSYEGEVFDRFEYMGIRERKQEIMVELTAVSNQSYPFREQRDCSGDLCFRNLSYDSEPVRSRFCWVFRPVETTIGGHRFQGFSYHFEYENPDCPIHRLLDRASWELGGWTG